MTERTLIDASMAQNLNHSILHYFNVAGADPDMRSGQSTRHATHLVKIGAEPAIGKRRIVIVFGNDCATPDGTGVRDYIHLSYLVLAHAHALEALIENPTVSTTMNCGYGIGFSVEEVIEAVERVAKTKIICSIEPRRLGD